MRIRKDKHNNFGTIWSASTRHFNVSLVLEQTFEQYDGDDDDGSIAADLESGELVMFDSKVVVEYGDVAIGVDYLCMSVYHDGRTLEFLKSGYFRDMLATACNEARAHFKDIPKMRASA